MTILDQVTFLESLRDRFGVSLNYEGILARQYSRFLHPGDVVFDVGAHEGVHTYLFADRVGPSGRVIAFEALPHLADRLREKFAAQQAFVTIHAVALSNARGPADFVFAQGLPGESGLKPRVFNDPAAANPTTIRVERGVLDDFSRSLDRLDYVKMDIEGGELDCLDGASDVWRRLRPVLSVEYGAAAYEAYGRARRDLWDVCASHRYMLTDIFGTPIPTLDVWMAVCDRVYWDYFCVPEEKRERFLHLAG